MKKFTVTEALEDLCKRTKQWCLYLSWCIIGEEEEGYQHPDPFNEMKKAAPFLELDDLACDKAVIFCDTEKEVYKLFEQVIGDDGPTELNSYNGPARIYALVIGPEGMMTENT